jgi:hypothetical protein
MGLRDRVAKAIDEVWGTHTTNATSAPISYPVLLTVVGWVFFLFCGFGLMSKVGPMPVIALAVAGIAVASAVL